MRTNDLGFVYPPVGGGIGYVERSNPNRRARQFGLRRFVRRLLMSIA